MRRHTHRGYSTFSVTVLPFTTRQSCTTPLHKIKREGHFLRGYSRTRSGLWKRETRTSVQQGYSYLWHAFHYLSLDFIMEVLQIQVSLPRNDLHVLRQWNFMGFLPFKGIFGALKFRSKYNILLTIVTIFCSYSSPTYCINLHVNRFAYRLILAGLVYSSTLKIQAVCSSETSVNY
jgi:hypothetical protein